MRRLTVTVCAAALVAIPTGCSSDPQKHTTTSAETPGMTADTAAETTDGATVPAGESLLPVGEDPALQAQDDAAATPSKVDRLAELGQVEGKAGTPLKTDSGAPTGPASPRMTGPGTPGPAGPAGRASPRPNAAPTMRSRSKLAHLAVEPETESYAGMTENSFMSAVDNALSTFAADVDTASYSNLRRHLTQGKLPPKAAVRVEEFVNAQDYHDPEPTGREPFAIATELADCPWQPEHRLLRIGLKTRSIATDRVPPCNLVFLIDVSGSMNNAQKLPLVVRAMRLLVDTMRSQDKVAIVTYASGVKVALETASGDDQDRIHQVLTNLRAGGSTNGQGGIQKAYELAQMHLVREGVNRVILATDGDFNVGIRNPDELETFIEARKDNGVFLTVLGVGSGNLKDDRLERLANKGNGVYAYLDSVHEARRILVEQFGASMMTVAKDVKLQLEFDPSKVAGYRQIGYENRQLSARDFRDDTKDAGELGAGHQMTALYEIVPIGRPLPGRETAADATAQLAATQSATQPATQPTIEPASNTDGPIATVRLRYKAPLADTARELAQPIDGAVTAPSRDFTVAAGAAALGMLLRGSAHLNGFGFADLSALIDDPQLEAAGLAETVASVRALQ